MPRSALLLATMLAASIPALANGRSAPAPVARNLEQSDHVSIRDEGGTGGAVFLIPGLSTPRAVWDAFLPGLRSRHHVYSVQVNGFGADGVGANLQPGVLEGIASEVDAYIVSRRIKAPAIVGHSMGGLAGMMLAKAHPGHVGRLLVIDALPYVGDSFRPGVTVAQVEPQARAMRDRIASGYGKPRDAGTAAELAATLAVTPAARTEIAGWLPSVDQRVAGQAMYEDMTTDMRPDVASLGLPITLVYPAEGDELFHSDFRMAPRATYVPVKGAGHFVMLDQPEVFSKALRDFLR